MDRNEKIKVISQAIYDDYIKKGWKNVSIYDCEVKAIHYVDTEIIVKKLTLTDVVKSFTAEQVVSELKDCETLDDAIMYFSEIK